MFKLLWTLIATLALLLPGLAHGQNTAARGDAGVVAARAVVSQTPLVPGGGGEIVVELTILPRYHIQSAFAEKPYIAAKLVVKALPSGVDAGIIQAQQGIDIPTPPALGTGTLSVYTGKAYFLLPLKIAADAAPGLATAELSVLTQACNNTTCDPPTSITLRVPLTIGKPGDTQSVPDAALITAAHSQTFAPQGVPATKSAPATTAATTPTTTATPTWAHGKFVPLLSTQLQLTAIAERPYKPFNAEEHQHTLPALFLFALLGGLILNIMPCVLPVIPLKALSLVQQAHGNHRLAILHSLAFSAGIVTLFIALAVMLRVFDLFYGQQFQSPAFLITMVMFVVALALSMLGVWTIQPPRAVYSADEQYSHRAGFLGSFSSGLMATLLATPCSAPFLGPVLAWALIQPAWITALMLAIVGVGMSLPYLVLALFPQALNKIPRAGRWSELLKQGLGIVMLGVAFYLVTLVPNTQLWPWILAGIVVLALVCWGWGQIPTPLMSAPRLWTIRAIVVAVGLTLGAGIWWIGGTTRPAMMANAADSAFLPDRTTDGNAWLPFNVALLDQALADGRPVVIDWTADWCLNCRVLEAVVLSRQQWQQAVIANNAVLLRADLSQDNPPADALNRKLGDKSIPVLAIYSPARPIQPVVLRDSYTPSRVIEELNTASR